MRLPDHKFEEVELLIRWERLGRVQVKWRDGNELEEMRLKSRARADAGGALGLALETSPNVEVMADATQAAWSFHSIDVDAWR